MKTLVIGDQGFIGQVLIYELSAKGHETYGYDLQSGEDIRDLFKLDKFFEKERFDVVLNLAARAGVASGEEYYEEYYSTNCVGLMNVIKMCQRYKVKKFVHLSSSAALKALSVYGITKLAGDHMVKNSGLDYALIRPFTVVGENGRKDMVVYKWLNQIKSGEPVTFYGDGTTYRGYTYVGDLVDGIIRAMDGPTGTYNLGGDQKVTLEELWEIFKVAYPDAERNILPLPDYDEPGELADTSKSFEVLGWKHTTNIKDKIWELIKQ